MYHFSPPYSLPLGTALIVQIQSTTYPCAFLTVRERPKYTCCFANSREMRPVSWRLGSDRKICPARRVTQEGDCFAKAHISTAQAPPRQDARISLAHEDRRRPQGSGGSPQEGTPSPYTRIRPGCSIRAKRGWCKRRSLTPCTVPGSAARVPISLLF